MNRWGTVRLSYLYIFGGSALLSGAFLYVVRSIFMLVNGHYTPESTALMVRFIRWHINHIGQTPLAVVFFILLFVPIFLLRTQKISGDLEELLRATDEIAEKGSVQQINVLSGGELGRIADNLTRINGQEQIKSQNYLKLWLLSWS